jgi:hypothetical protein
MNDFKSKIYSCSCNECVALKWLVEECGANLVFSESKAGRLCELAVVAGSAQKGISSFLTVVGRRKYAAHLGIKLEGPVSNANEPNHIEHPISNPKNNPIAHNPIDLGRAKAKKIGNSYFISMGKIYAD